MFPDKAAFFKLIQVKTSRSSGPGGQNVNKVSSRVELIFNIDEASFLSEAEKLRLKEKLGAKLDTLGNLHVLAQEERSQLLNKEKAFLKLQNILRQALKIEKVRKATKVSKAAKERAKRSKMAQSEKKQNRKSVL